MKFFVGLHIPAHAHKFGRCMVSINSLRDRKSDLRFNDWMLDSGAFSEIFLHGRFRTSVEEYAEEAKRWHRCGKLLCAVSQDYMCEAVMLAKTGLTVADHQRLTIERYDALKALVPREPYILPVLQGYEPDEYVSHIEQYGNRLGKCQWVGVGSVCKRNVDVEAIESVLVAIKRKRPDLSLHGFGVKITAFRSPLVRRLLTSADSMAWSFAARRNGQDRNHWTTAMAFVHQIEAMVGYAPMKEPIAPRRRYGSSR